MAAIRTHTFIVRIWEEPREISDKPSIWRGSIERVSDQQRIHFSKLSEMQTFIARSVRSDAEQEGKAGK